MGKKKHSWASILNSVSDWYKLLGLIVLVVESVLVLFYLKSSEVDPWRGWYFPLMLIFFSVIVIGIFIDRYAQTKITSKSFNQGKTIVTQRERVEPLVQHYSNKEQAYIAATDALSQALTKDDGNMHAALHGLDGERLIKPFQSTPEFESFDTQMSKCIKSYGRSMWHVKKIYYIPNKERLEMILKRLEETKTAEGFEVRIFTMPETIPNISPLIIGEKDAFIGFDHYNRYYRTDKAIHFRGKEFVNIMTGYFESLWHNQRAKEIRSPIGIEYKAIDKLMKELPK